MSCLGSQNIVIDEMTALLKFIETENSQYEREKNELRALYQNRPPEEKNIIKDILAMHSEFNQGVDSVTTMIDELTTIPSDKSSIASTAESIASEIVAMQAQLVQKHEKMQTSLIQKTNYKNIKDQAIEDIKNFSLNIEQMRFKTLEIENYEHYNIYSKKVKFLNGEIQRLRSLIVLSENQRAFESAPAELWDENVSQLTDKQAAAKLQQIKTENKRLEEAIGRLNMQANSELQYLKNRKIAEEKKKRVAELKTRLDKLTTETERVNSPFGDSSRKIKMLDTIIGRKSSVPQKPTSPREKTLKNFSLMQEIEASLTRVKSLGSPIGSPILRK